MSTSSTKFLHALRSELSVLGLNFFTSSLLYCMYMTRDLKKSLKSLELKWWAFSGRKQEPTFGNKVQNHNFCHNLTLVSSHTRRWPYLLLSPLNRSLWILLEICSWWLTALRPLTNNGLGRAFQRSSSYRKTGENESA